MELVGWLVTCLLGLLVHYNWGNVGEVCCHDTVNLFCQSSFHIWWEVLAVVIKVTVVQVHSGDNKYILYVKRSWRSICAVTWNAVVLSCVLFCTYFCKYILRCMVEAWCNIVLWALCNKVYIPDIQVNLYVLAAARLLEVKGIITWTTHGFRNLLLGLPESWHLLYQDGQCLFRLKKRQIQTV